jgi:hypothetical protein
MAEGRPAVRNLLRGAIPSMNNAPRVKHRNGDILLFDVLSLQFGSIALGFNDICALTTKDDLNVSEAERFIGLLDGLTELKIIVGIVAEPIQIRQDPFDDGRDFS